MTEQAKREPDGDANNAKKVHDAHIRYGLARTKETVAAAKMRQLDEELNRVHQELVRSRQEAGEVKAKVGIV